MRATPRWMSLFVASSALAVMPGCVASVHPLSDTRTSDIDRQLLGDWMSDDDRSSKIHIRPHKEVRNACLWTFTSPDDEPRKCVVFTTRLKEHRYISFQLVDKNTPTRRAFLFQRYVITDDTLQLYRADRDVWIEAIRSKLISGVVDTEEVLNRTLDRQLEAVASRRKQGQPPSEEKLPSRVSPAKDDENQSVLVTASTRQLRAFVTGQGDRLFSKDGKSGYQRVRP